MVKSLIFSNFVVGRFWSGCAQAVKHGLEIMGIGLVDMDSNNCIMLRGHQTPSQKKRGRKRIKVECSKSASLGETRNEVNIG